LEAHLLLICRLKIVEQLGPPIDKMRNNLGDPWSAQDLCALTGLSTSQTRRLFRTYLRMSPRQWLLRERLMLAQSLIVRNESALAGIVEQCGFCDVYHLAASSSVRSGSRRPLGAGANWALGQLGYRRKERRKRVWGDVAGGMRNDRAVGPARASRGHPADPAVADCLDRAPPPHRG
jgi:AraC-like DNA-binding protein